MRQDFQNRVGQWGEQTFPQSTPVSIAKHLQEEAAELLRACEEWERWDPEATPDPPRVLHARIREEAADVLLLLTHLPYRLGFDLQAAAEEKFAVNQRW